MWLAIVGACVLKRDAFTLEGILSYTPRQPLLAALLLLALFAVKSLSVFLYSGFLFAASGILFPLPAAIAVNLAGAAVMVSLPYWLGKASARRRCSTFCGAGPEPRCSTRFTGTAISSSC